MKKYVLVSMALVAVASAIAFINFQTRVTIANRIGSEIVLTLNDRPEFLTEHLALECASNALARAGLKSKTWVPVVNRRTTAPNGLVDVYLLRNQINANLGTIQFSGKDSQEVRLVALELKDRVVTCRVILPK